MLLLLVMVMDEDGKKVILRRKMIKLTKKCRNKGEMILLMTILLLMVRISIERDRKKCVAMVDQTGFLDFIMVVREKNLLKK